jgi:hypothetical protein
MPSPAEARPPPPAGKDPGARSQELAGIRSQLQDPVAQSRLNQLTGAEVGGNAQRDPRAGQAFPEATANRALDFFRGDINKTMAGDQFGTARGNPDRYFPQQTANAMPRQDPTRFNPEIERMLGGEQLLPRNIQGNASGNVQRGQGIAFGGERFTPETGGGRWARQGGGPQDPIGALSQMPVIGPIAILR